MAKREDLFKDEAISSLDELDELIKEMREDGTCLTDDIRRIADELDETWKSVMETAEAAEEEDINEED